MAARAETRRCVVRLRVRRENGGLYMFLIKKQMPLHAAISGERDRGPKNILYVGTAQSPCGFYYSRWPP